MDKTEHRPRRNPYRKRGERAWALIQARYLAGESAGRLAEVFKVTEYAIRARIWREGWSKAALAEAEEAGLPDPDAALAEMAAGAGDETASGVDPRTAARLALDTAVRLMREGRMSAAAEAARVADVMARAAARLDGGAPEDPGEPDEAAFEAVRRKVLGMPRPQGEEDREAVEGATAGAVSCPLPHPADGPPPPMGEEGCAAATPPPPFGWPPSAQGGEEMV